MGSSGTVLLSLENTDYVEAAEGSNWGDPMTTIWNSRPDHNVRRALLTVAFGAVMASPLLATGQVADSGQQVTFTKDIAPILQRSCQRCHRPESVAPMSLLTYEDARPWARAMKHRTGLRNKPDTMPPWYLEKDVGIQQFKGDLSLSEEEILTIARWADSGAPRGNPADMPPPLEFTGPNEWQIGEPDLIISSPSIEVAAFAPDYWAPMGKTPTGLTEDRYVAAIEMKEVNDAEPAPNKDTVGGLYVIHHMAFITVDADGKPLDDAVRGWPVHEVGRNADYFHADAGRPLLAGSQLLFPSSHLHSNGRHTNARLDIGFKFHPKGYEPKWKVQSIGPSTPYIDLKGLEADQEFEALTALTENTMLTVFEPHLHAAGVRMCLEAVWGSQVETLNCAGYNHSWVTVYTYEDDVAPLLPKGTILRARAWFDTTPANRNVVDPRNWTGMGHRSVDQMLLHLGRGFHLTDEEFEQAVAERREQLNLAPGQLVVGCPLCAEGFADPDPEEETAETAEAQQQQ